MKKILKSITHYALSGVRSIIIRHPSVKDAIKRAIKPHINLGDSQYKGIYDQWVNNNLPDAITASILKRQSDQLTYRPLISVVVPTYNTDLVFLRDCLESVMAQVYENWELCIVDDASSDSRVRDIIKEYSLIDGRIKYKFLKTNRHIAGATNEAIKMVTGEYVALFDHDDVLWPNALFEVVRALNDDNSIDFLYSDEDKITKDRKDYGAPFFKPDWNPDFLHSVNYITHLAVVRKTLLDKVGGPKKEYNGAQDWDLFLRITSATDRIHHIPTVLYSWRIHDQSTAKSTDSKPYVIEAQRKAIHDDLTRRGYADAIVRQDPKNKGY